MSNPSMVKFEDLTPEGKEAVTPSGEYKDPSKLDKGSGFEGAPKGDKKSAKSSSSKSDDDENKTKRRST